MPQKLKILITGAAGFIGFHAVRYFAENGYDVVGVDNMNDYYDVNLKYARLAKTGITKDSIKYESQSISSYDYNFRFIQADITESHFLKSLFLEEKFDIVCHLAAQAGVRYSITNPEAYIQSNITGFFNILESCRHYGVKHLVYASSSSVYGLNEKAPFSETDKTDTPVSLYAASKKTNELLAHTYSKLYQLPTTGLRFFTVYGPWGRPDMAPILFMKSILNQEPIQVFNHGKLSRDFTFIDDIISGLSAIALTAPKGEIPYKIYNIGSDKPVELLQFIEAIEQSTGKKAIKIMTGMQKGDVLFTHADIAAIKRDFNYSPKTSIQEGIDKLYLWYVDYYKKLGCNSTIKIQLN